jgi:hypothetical protein
MSSVEPRSTLWRLMAYLHIIHAHQPDPALFVNDVVTRCILPGSLERLRRNTTAFLQDSCEKRDAVTPFLAKGSLFETSVLSPVSFEDFDDCFEDILPIHASAALRRAFRLPPIAADTTTPTTSLSAQFLIEGLDCWMNDDNEVSKDERRRMVRACGVSPAAIDEGLQLNPYALSDFIIDVVFPEGSRWLDASTADWLTFVYTSTIKPQGDSAMVRFFRDNQVKRDNVGCNEEDTTVGKHAAVKAQVKRQEKVVEKKKKDAAKSTLMAVKDDNNGDVSSHATAGNAAANEDDEDLLVSEDNIQDLLSSAPHLLPKDVLAARRKSILDSTITVFELENHFTLPELKSEVAKVQKEIKARQKPSPSTKKSFLDAADNKDLWKGKKSDVVSKLLASVLVPLRALFQALPPDVVDVDADSSDSPCDTTSPPATDDIGDSSKDQDAGETLHAWLVKAASAKTTSKVLIKQIVDTYSRAQLNDYLVTSAVAAGRPRLSQDEILKLKTKLDCAKKIVADLN